MKPFLSSAALEKLRQEHPIFDAIVKDRIASLDEWYRRYRKLVEKWGAGFIVRPRAA